MKSLTILKHIHMFSTYFQCYLYFVDPVCFINTLHSKEMKNIYMYLSISWVPVTLEVVASAILVQLQILSDLYQFCEIKTESHS